MTATRFNSKAGHMSNMLVCNQFKKIRRTVRPTDAHWAEFIGYENSTSTSVELGIRGHWERFPIKAFEGEHSFTLGGERHEGADRWPVRGIFRAIVRGVSLSKPGKSGG